MEKMSVDDFVKLKLSAALRLTVDECERIENGERKNVSLEMTRWAITMDDGVCYVCMAGAAMLGTGTLDPSNEDRPVYIQTTSFLKLNGVGAVYRALDSLRTCALVQAVRDWNIHGVFSDSEALQALDTEVWDMRLEYRSYYDIHKHLPWYLYLEIANKLEAIGL